MSEAMTDAPKPAPISEWVMVPHEPYPEMLGAWYRYKNGHHFAGEPAPADTSDYGAYRAMIAAAPSRRAHLPSSVTDEQVEAAYWAFIKASDWQDWDADEIRTLIRAALSAASLPHSRDDAQVGAVTDAARDVLAERARQVSVEGWTPEHDDKHGKGEMVLAASSYLLSVDATNAIGFQSKIMPSYWPWAKSWWKPGPVRRMLVKAAALIIAEIERLDRALSHEAGK